MHKVQDSRFKMNERTGNNGRSGIFMVENMENITVEAEPEASNLDPDENQNQLVSQLSPFLNILRFTGSCPLHWRAVQSSTTQAGKGHTQFYFSWKSPFVYLALVITLIYLYVLTSYFLPAIFGITWIRALYNFDYAETTRLFPKKALSESTRKMNYYLNACVPILRFFCIVYALFDCRPFIRLLNIFIDLEMELRDTFRSGLFGCHFKVNFQLGRSVVKVVALGLGLPSCAAIPSVIFLLEISQNSSQFLVENILAFFTSSMIITCMFMEDIKFIIVSRIIREFYSQLNKGINVQRFYLEQEVEKNPDPATSLLKVQEVKRWLRLLSHIRTTCGEFGEVVKTQQLVLIVEAMVHFTIFLYSMVDAVTGQSLSDESILSVYHFAFSCSFPFISMVRLYIKTITAEKIIKEENLLAEEVLKVQNLPNSLDTQLELKSMFELIQGNPVKVNLGNYATMNKGLFLKISNQTIVYLIVLLQFGRILNES